MIPPQLHAFDLNRRRVLHGFGALATLPILGSNPALAVGQPLHGLSVFGNLKYEADFQRFDYVNSDAPQGGTFTMTTPNWQYNQNPQTFNTLNGFVLQGDAPARIEFLFDSLLARAFDEPDAMYGQLAESVEISQDNTTYTFRLRPEARFHDGTMVRAQDVAFSFMLLKDQGHPNLSQTLRELVNVEAIDDQTVAVIFTGDQTRQLPLFVGTLPVFSEAYYQENEFDASTSEPPIGSGPYRVERFELGRFIEYRRDPDYWGRDLPVNVGHNNFDLLRIEFFRERQVAFEAFKKGEISFREEFSSKTWSTEYNFPAVEDGRVIRGTFPDETPAGAQGWFINTRRSKFADPRTREALGLAFDFEWSNQSLFYGLYQRTHSVFENSEMKADGAPTEAELALLEPHRDTLPETVFIEPYTPPVSDGSGQDRRMLRRATQLLRDAGWNRVGTELVNADGDVLTVEFLANTTVFERITNPVIANLKRLGVEANFRLVDPAQYQARQNDFDFDFIGRRFSFLPTPGESIRQFFSSDSADTSGSFNLSGIAEPVVDVLVENMIRATSREDMVTAARALDRVLRAGHYWIPQWFKASHNVAYWDEYGWPEPMPKYAFQIERLWWYDKQKAERIGRA
ncbi:MAG: extracellular solute-binding protein [Pseudomonadota bacterium]